METIGHILSDVSHRPYELSSGKWQYYQEWNSTLFLHWKVPYDSLRSCVPEKFNIDTFGGDCYVSIVAFTMQNIRPRNLPALKFLSDFHEINLRTYIDNDNRQGVYFLNIEAEKLLSALFAKTLSGLPYEKARMKRTDTYYHSNNPLKNFHLDAIFEIKSKLIQKTALDIWLTERYCLYFHNNKKFYRYDVHHLAWELKNVEVKQLQLNYKIDNLVLTGLQPDLAHYSDGVKVLAWQKQLL